MRCCRQFLARLRTLFQRGRVEREIARDVNSQLALLADEFQRRGLPPDEARRAARRAYGGVEQAKESARDELTFVPVEQFFQDARHASRALAKTPAFTAIALLWLALGIGANTAIFTLVNGVLLKNLPVPDPGRVVQVQAQIERFHFEALGFNYPAFRELRRQAEIFSDLIGFSRRPALAEFDGDSRSVGFEMVTGSFFAFFNARPAAGRLLDAEDDRVEGAHPVCVLSYPIWQSWFGGDPRAVGRTIRVGGVPLRVVGIAARGFVGPELQWRADVWVPSALAAAFGNPRETPNWIWLHLLGRLRPSLSLRVADARLAAASRAIEDALPRQRANAGAVYRLHDASKGFDTWRSRLHKPLLVLMGAVLLVLLIACANLANILLARIQARRQEFAIKLSLGISRFRLLRQLLVETALLVFSGGALGVLLAMALTALLLDVINSGSPANTLRVAPDMTVLAFTVAVCVLTAMAAGLYPAWQASRSDAGAGLIGASRAGRRFGAVRRALILVQVTVAVVLLFGASLFTHSLGKLKAIDLGYDIDRVLSVDIEASGPRSALKSETAPAALTDVLARVRQLPYVEAAAFAEPGVLSGGMMMQQVRASRALNPRQAGEYVQFAGPRYFATMRMPLLRGRDFAPTDRPGDPPVAIINQRLASLLWPGEDPIGKQIASWNSKLPDLTVIGLVGNSKYQNVREETRPIAYQCFDQTPVSGGTLEIRYRGSAAQVEREVRPIIKTAAPAYHVSNASTMELLRDGWLAQDRLLTFLSALFGTLGLALALTGIYGLISYAVVQRTREIGIRVSVGARQADVLRLFLRESLLLTVAGVVFGVPLALALARFVRAMLFEVSSADPAGLSVTLAAILFGGLVASAVPARRAARLDPVKALRYE